MTAVSADNTTMMQSKIRPADGFATNLPVAASTTIYSWTFVALDADGYLTSYVAPAVYTGATATGTSRVRGIALEHVDNSSGSDGDKTCKVMIDGYFTYALSGVAVTDVGGPVFATDNATMSASAIGSPIGHIVAYDRSGYCTVKLDPFAAYNGNLLTVVSPTVDYCTANQKILLVHECDNHNGLICAAASAYTSEAHVCQTTQGIITLQHTADEGMGITITATDNSPVADILVAIATLWTGASDAATVIAPAGKQINAEVTTASAEGGSETGQVEIYAAFMAAK